MNEERDVFKIPETMLCQKKEVSLDWFKAQNIGAGLLNCGNTCFINSILQCLTHTTPLVSHFTTSDHGAACKLTGFCMMCELQTHIRCSYENSGSVVVPASILQNIKLIARHMELGLQEDAHEFLIHTLNAMERSCIKALNGWDQFGENNTVVHKIFGGLIRSQVKCVQCRGESNTYQPFIDMNLEIKNARTLEEAFANYVQLESLGDEAYSCAKCDKRVEAVKGMAIAKAPNVLTVSLQRFDYMFGKICHQVRFPERLDIRPYLNITQGDTVMYELYAVVVHSGNSCNSGHYYSFVKSVPGNWFLMNDSKVTPVPVAKVLASQAYLLFYKRCGESNTQKNTVSNEHTQKNTPVTNTKDSLRNGATGEPNIVGSLLSVATSSRRPQNNARNDDKSTNLNDNHATVKKKRPWRKAFSQELDHGKKNASSTNNKDPLPTGDTTTAPPRKRIKIKRL